MRERRGRRVDRAVGAAGLAANPPVYPPVNPPANSVMLARLIRLVPLVVVMLLVPLGGTPATAVGDESDPFSEPRPPVTANDFIPTDRDLTDCLSALPRPGCGSEARGGWRQTAIFGALIVGLGVIFTRIVFGLRRRPAAASPTTAPTDTESAPTAQPDPH